MAHAGLPLYQPLVAIRCGSGRNHALALTGPVLADQPIDDAILSLQLASVIAQAFVAEKHPKLLRLRLLLAAIDQRGSASRNWLCEKVLAPGLESSFNYCSSNRATQYLMS
jgi:hypothetical protein